MNGVNLTQKEGHLALNGKHPDRFHEFLNTKNVDDPPQVIGQHMQTHFRTHMFDGFHQEVRRTHPELERTKDMFDGTPPLFHLSRVPVQAILHRIQNAFMFPSSDAPFLARRALRFQLAALTR